MVKSIEYLLVHIQALQCTTINLEKKMSQGTIGSYAASNVDFFRLNQLI